MRDVGLVEWDDGTNYVNPRALRLTLLSCHIQGYVVYSRISMQAWKNHTKQGQMTPNFLPAKWGAL